MGFPTTDYPLSVDAPEARADGVDIVHDDDFNYQDEQIRQLQTYIGASLELLGAGVAGRGPGGLLSPAASGGTALQLLARNNFLAGKILSIGDDYDAAPPAYTELAYLDYSGLLWTQGGADFSDPAASLLVPIHVALPAAGSQGRVAFQSGAPAGLYVDDGAAWVGPFAGGWTEQQTIHVGKHGNDANAGTSPALAKLTITAAVAQAVADGAGPGNPYVVVCADSGIYIENVTLPSYVSLWAPSAQITGFVALNDYSDVRVGSVVAGNGVTGAVRKLVGGVAASHAFFRGLVAGDGSIGLVNLAVAGELLAEFDSITVGAGSYGVGSIAGPNGYTRITGEAIYLAGAASTAVARTGAGTLVGRIAHILETGAGAGTGTGINVVQGSISLFCNLLETTVAYAVAAPAMLELNSNFILGTRSSAGISRVFSLVPEQKTIYVGKHGHDGSSGYSQKEAKLTIAAAQAAALALTPTASNRIVIRIGPGIYTNAVTTTSQYVDFEGSGQGVTILNPAAGTALTISHSNVSVRDLSVYASDPVATGRCLMAGGAVSSVKFRNVTFHRAWDVAFSPVVYLNQVVGIEFFSCSFTHVNPASNRYAWYSEVAAGVSSVRFWDCVLGAEFYSKGGYYELYDCAIQNTGAQAVYLSTTAAAMFRMCGGFISSAGHGVNVQIGLDWELTGVRIIAAVANYDVTAAVGPYPGTMLGCKLTRGLGPSVVLTGLNRPIGFARDFVSQYLYTEPALGPTDDLIGWATIDPSSWYLAAPVLNGAGPVYFEVVVAMVSAGVAVVTLYDVGPAAGPPGVPSPVASLTTAVPGGPQRLSTPLTVSAAGPAPNVMSNAARMYEVRVTLAGGAPGDTVLVGGGALVVRP